MRPQAFRLVPVAAVTCGYVPAEGPLEADIGQETCLRFASTCDPEGDVYGCSERCRFGLLH